MDRDHLAPQAAVVKLGQVLDQPLQRRRSAAGDGVKDVVAVAGREAVERGRRAVATEPHRRRDAGLRCRGSGDHRWCGARLDEQRVHRRSEVGRVERLLERGER
jgi:hypothetical protein